MRPHLFLVAALSVITLLCVPQGILARDTQPALVSLFLPSSSSSSGRLTYRAAKTKAKTDKQRKSSASSASSLEYRDLINGLSVQYPKGWSYVFSPPESGVTARYDWTIFSSSTAQYTSLAVGVLNLKKPVTTADLQKDFALYTQEPKYAEDFQNSHFLIMPNVLSSVLSTWQKKETHVGTFTHRYQSRDRKVRQIRIPSGNRIIVLEYSATPDRFDRDLHLFEDFTKSFALLR
ncbi:MAG: hypothetical protein Q7S29_05330 [Candidatus Peribacter sp.]|nr:hypothetical protein [Candidatus Peribacter sp.]